MAVSILQVLNELQENTYNLGSLCTSPNINKWSFWKPIQTERENGITEDDLFLINDGFTNFSFNSPIDAVQGFTTRWQYLKPTDNFRLGDFRNYNHRAAKWFNLNINSLDYGAVGDSIHFSLDGDFTFLMNFSAFEGLYPNIDVGLLISKDQFTESSTSCYYYKVANIQDIDTEKISLKIPADFSIGTYYCIPVLTTDIHHLNGDLVYYNTAGSGSGTWYLLPSDPVLFSVQSEPLFNPFNYIDFKVTDGNYSYTEQFIFDLIFNAHLAIKPEYNASPMRVSIDIIYKNAEVSGQIQDILINRQSYSDLMAGNRKDYEVFYTDSIYYLGGKIDEQIPLTVKIAVYIANITYYKDFTIYIPTSQIYNAKAK